MTNDEMSSYRNDIGFDYAIHSDFLVHWTGKDIDPRNWDDGLYSTTNQVETEQYVERLRNILKFGLWMTEEEDDNPHLNAPKVPRTCFTELRLSLARRHARKFGRLGIGVKRFFVFNRGGRPLAYYGTFKDGKPVNDTLLDTCRDAYNKGHIDGKILNFFKPMHSTIDPKTKQYIFNYDLYSESEWRIIYTGQDKAEDPRGTAYFEGLDKGQKAKLKYLLPLGYHLCLIIYPSIAVKRAAQKDVEIRNLIGGLCLTEGECQLPIEVDLDACRNF
jgi:hypothetical protein